MPDLESAYLRLPVRLQDAAWTLQGWRVRKFRFGQRFHAILREAESRTCWSEDRMRAFRDQRLRLFVQHCAKTVPFYRHLFREAGVCPDDIRTLADLSRIPILTRKDVQVRSPEFVSEAVPRRMQVASHTSGTTGAGLRFVATPDAIREQWAVWWRYRGWHGIRQGTWCGGFGGRSVVPLAQKRPPFWRYDRSRREILFSAYHMSPVNLGAYAAELRRTQPPWLHGYPSVLALLASYIVEVGFDLGYRVRWVTTGAENLLSHQADLIDRAFGVRPRQHYGLAEAVANISECDMGALHVDEDFAAVEFEPGPDGAGHGIVGTNFSNPATPLLRYRTQDFVTLSDLPCACGRPGRVVAGVDGRLEDYVVLRNGARIGRMDHVFKDLTNIREAQIHQRVPGEITIRVVRGNRYSRADETKLLREAGKRVGEGTAVHVEYVGQLDRSPSNKLRLVVSEIPRGRLVPHGTPCAVTTRP